MVPARREGANLNLEEKIRAYEDEQAGISGKKPDRPVIDLDSPEKDQRLAGSKLVDVFGAETFVKL